MTAIQVPGAWIVEQGRKHLRVYPWASSVQMMWVAETGERAEFRVDIKAIRCGNMAHPMGAWWTVADTTLAPVPMCPRCLEDGRKEAEATLSDEALAEWRMHMDYAQRMWTDLQGVV